MAEIEFHLHNEVGIKFPPLHPAYSDGELFFGRFRGLVARGTGSSCIGEGGTARIHLVRDELMEREVALKIPLESIQRDPATREDVIRETRQAMELTHPNIVRIHDFHEAGGKWGISMQYVRGKNLDEWRYDAESTGLRRVIRPYPMEAIRDWIAQLCDALRYVHEDARMVHRDIKPKNLMLEKRDGRETVYITDFGISQRLHQYSQTLSRVQTTPVENKGNMGTLPYMPWEQIAGEPPSPLDDVYAVGATIYELITGRPPFYDGDFHQIKLRIREVPPPTMEQRILDLGLHLPPPPDVWEQVVAACLAKRPEDRPPSMRAVAAALGLQSADATKLEVKVSSQAQRINELESQIINISHTTGPLTPSADPAVAVQLAEARQQIDHSRDDIRRLEEQLTAARRTEEDVTSRLQEAARQAEEQAARHAAEQAAKHAAEQAAKLAAEQAGRLAAEHTAKLAAEQAAKLAAEQAARQAAEQAARHASEQAARHAAEQTAKLAAEQAARQAAEQAAKHASEQAARHAAEQTAKLAAEQAARQAAEQAAKLAAEQAARHAAEQTAKLAAEQAARQAAELAAKHASEQAARHAAEQTAKLAAEQAARHAAEQAAKEKARRAAGQSDERRRETDAGPAKPLGQDRAERRGRSWRPIVLASIAAAILILLGTAAWLLEPRLRGHAKVARESPANPELSNTTSGPIAPGVIPNGNPPPPTPPPQSTSSTIKVPGQAATLRQAIELCNEGGTIEIAGGTFDESVLLIKSVSLVADPPASIVARDQASNLIIAKGPIKATLSNIHIVNTSEGALLSPDESPALVLVSDKASITFDHCVIEGSVGNGITLADNASASFSECQVRDNRAWGINGKSASSVSMSRSEILRNGRSGIAMANVGSLVTLGPGCRVSENSLNGVELAEGAELQAEGVEIADNHKAGVTVVGSGSLAAFEAKCGITGNGTHGIAVQHSGTARLRNVTVEQNKEHGLWAGKSAGDNYSGVGSQADIHSCGFVSNGLSGVFLDDGKTAGLKLEKTGFTSHSQCGVAVSGGRATVLGCDFKDNGAAILFGDGANGAITDNSIHPGPLESSVILENAGEVSMKNNTVPPPHPKP